MTVLTKTFSNIPIDYDMLFAYLGIKDKREEFTPILKECLNEVLDKLSYRVCYCSFSVSKLCGGLDLSFTISNSKKLNEHIKNCTEIIVFSSTIGIEIDKLIKKYNHISPLKALIFEGIGTERIESLCNAFCTFLTQEYSRQNKLLKSRFSPGYGDLPIETQKDIFKVLNPNKYIGLTLNDSMLMSPSKSVTAIIGVYDKDL